MSTVNVALLYQTSQFETHLKDALRELGAAVVYEALTAKVDRDALEGSGANVVIVNLDPEVEAHLDEVYDLLDDQRYNVLFNDGTVSSGLSGWDQARWARHLAAKILNKPEATDPPRPANSTAPRSPAQRLAETIPDLASKPTLEIPRPDLPTLPATPSPFAGDTDLNAALDALLARADTPGTPSLRPVQADPGQVTMPEREAPTSHHVDLRAEMDAKSGAVTPSTKPVPPPPASVSDGFDFAAELDSLVGSIPDSTLGSEAAVPPPRPTAAFDNDFDLDVRHLERDVPAASSKPAAASAAKPSSDFASDIEALFGNRPNESSGGQAGSVRAELSEIEQIEVGEVAADFSADLSNEFDMSAFDAAAEPPMLEGDFPSIFDRLDDEVSTPVIESQTVGGITTNLSDWSLDAVDEESNDTPTPLPAASAAKREPEPRAAAESFGVKKVSTEDFLAGKDWSLSAVDEGGDAAPAPTPVQKVKADEYLAPEGGDASKFDFSSVMSLDLVPMEEAIAPEDFNKPEAVSVEHRLEGSSIGTPKGVVKRVIVLGASIGGPEAVREYLAAIPAKFPALFLLAQHMGAEFLELMSAQLAKVTPLTVRNPTHGERVGHGEVIVIPTDKRLVVDADGVVQLKALSETSPYSPSIDLVIHDIADNFGPAATAIVFSGMAHDAIEGSKYLAAKGGKIWVQDPDTCVISSMVDGAMEAGVVSFSAGPAQLAQQTLAVYGKA
jgi:hypothetical protein